MTLQDLGALGEIVGGLAVLATLVYLAIQVRQANKTTHRQMYASAAESASKFWFKLSQDPQLYSAFTRTLRDEGLIDNVARDQGYLVLDSYLALMESFYLHNIEYGEILSQERLARNFSRLVTSPGGSKYWLKRRDAFHATFVEYIDEIVKNADQPLVAADCLPVLPESEYSNTIDSRLFRMADNGH